MEKDIFKQIIIENQEFISSVTLFNRELFIEEHGNYVFVGSRRAGKTYTMFQIMKQMITNGLSVESILYINFEDERLLELKPEELSLVTDAYKELFNRQPIIFLDEVQSVSGWEKFTRRLADQAYRIFVTGSNAQMLSNEIATTLGGRFLIQEIYPFSFNEYLHANGLLLLDNWEFSSQRFEVRRLFDDYFHFGGFPEILKFEEKRIWLNNLYQKIFFGDLITRYKIRNDFAMKLIVKKMAESIHDEMSFRRVKNIIQSTGIKIGTSTVIEYLAFLEETWLMFSIQNYLSKINDRESQKKFYFIDNGILSLFLLRPETILLENIVAIALYRRFKDQLFYLREQNEVDFYIPHERCLIQVAFNLTLSETQVREEKALVKNYPGVEVNRRMIITMDTEKDYEVDNCKIEVIPVWKWLIMKV